ncbi:hypothetical protein BDU57DRAFT_543633 [Ampelomyces quisqualis]|uniref:Uncharacterized protein n=1 Tax=Ampelomyces quisqualis TaxID=50730 RepID=A0A6A5Q5R1_AMPQU|nr:hypothetical protein BDU57DRAFT_543633 [Ampelomyces quisqualis]
MSPCSLPKTPNALVVSTLQHPAVNSSPSFLYCFLMEMSAFKIPLRSVGPSFISALHHAQVLGRAPHHHHALPLEQVVDPGLIHTDRHDHVRLLEQTDEPVSSPLKPIVTRAVAGDPNQSPDGTVTATSAAMLPNLPIHEFMLAIGAAKPDAKLKPAMYSDVIIIGRNKDWTLSQWVVREVIMEPVPAETRKRVMSVTTGFYWHNASWGVDSNVTTFAHKSDNGSIAQTTSSTIDGLL